MIVCGIMNFSGHLPRCSITSKCKYAMLSLSLSPNIDTKYHPHINLCKNIYNSKYLLLIDKRCSNPSYAL